MTTRISEAIDELQSLIKGRYPTATFEIATGTYLTVTVDLDDPDEVMDLVIDRLLELQVDEELPVYVLPVRPWARVVQTLQSQVSSSLSARPRAML